MTNPKGSTLGPFKALNYLLNKRHTLRFPFELKQASTTPPRASLSRRTPRNQDVLFGEFDCPLLCSSESEVEGAPI